MTLVIPGSKPSAPGGAFAMGTSNDGMGKTLDEMITDRRKDQVKASKGRGSRSTRASTADRSVASGRAKREAAAKARRGMTQSNKPTAMEVEKEVYRKSRTTAKAKKANERKSTGGRAPPNSSLREKNNARSNKKGGAKGQKKATEEPVAVFGIKNASKKAIAAAAAGIKAAGIPIPDGYGVHVTFVPTMVAVSSGPAKPDPKGKKKAQPANQKGGNGGGNSNNGRGGGRGRGRK